MTGTLGQAFIKPLRELDGLLDDRDTVFVPSDTEPKLAQAEEHVTFCSLGPGLVKVRQSAPENFLCPHRLALVHEQKTELVLASRHQSLVVFQRIQREGFVSEFDRSTEIAALLIRDAQAVVSPCESWQVSQRARRLQGFFVVGDGSIECVILDMNGRDVLENPCLRTGVARLGD